MAHGLVELSYLNEESSDFDKIWYTTADLELSTIMMNSVKIQDGRSRQIKNCFLVITQ